VLGVAPNRECKLSINVDIFILGGLRRGMRLFGVASATPCHPGRTATDCTMILLISRDLLLAGILSCLLEANLL